MTDTSLAGSAEQDAGSTALPRFLPASAIVATFIAMLAFSWGTWPDVLVDFGHELYSAWRLSEGQVLSRDVAIGATGALSPYFNALLFKVFGVGLRTLVLGNLALLGVLIGLLYAMLREIAGRAAATGAILFFLTVFAFNQYVGIGNYNYVAPYSHGVTHGLVLAFLALALRWRFARTGALRDLVGASLCLGLVVLTKPEVLVAAGGAAAVDLVLQLRRAGDAKARVRLLLAATVPVLAPPAIALAALSAVADRSVAWQATFSPWLTLGSPLARTPFYVSGLGLDDPAGNLLLAAGWLAGSAALLVPTAFLDLRLGVRRSPWLAPALAAAVVAVAAWAWVPRDAPFALPRALPLAMALGGAWVLVRAWRSGRSLSPGSGMHAALVTFAGLLLLKMGLNARIYHYGFALAMPATLLIVAWLLSSVPRFLRQRGGSGRVFQAVVATALVLFAGACVRASASRFAAKTVTVASGPDAFRADGRGALVNAVMAGLAREPDREGTLAVLPEGVMINYLTRREFPSPYLAYMPDAIAWKGEQGLLGPLIARSPTYVLIVSRDASEHGARTFGRDYARATWRWIQGLYEPIGQAGGSPFDPNEYGMLLLRRRGDGAG